MKNIIYSFFLILNLLLAFYFKKNAGDFGVDFYVENAVFVLLITIFGYSLYKITNFNKRVNDVRKELKLISWDSGSVIFKKTLFYLAITLSFLCIIYFYDIILKNVTV